MKYLSVLIPVLFVFSCVGYAGDWPQYKRDSARRGDAPDEVLTFPMQRIMAVRLPSPIYASPAVVEGKVYVQDARGNVVCADAGSSKVLWTINIGGIANHSSPAISGDRVFIGSSAGHLAILDAKTGKLIKKVPAEGGVIAAPAVEKDNIYFSTIKGKLVKIDREGTVIWTFDGGRASNVEFAVRNGGIIFLGYDVKQAEPESAKHLKQGPRSAVYDLLDKGQTVQLRGSCKIRNPTGGPVFGDGFQAAVQTFDTENGILWLIEHGEDGKVRVRKLIPHALNDTRATPSFRNGRYYRGNACAVPPPADKLMGIRPIWTTGRSVLYHGMFHSSPALAKSHLAVGSEAGKVYFIPLGEDLKPQKRRSHVQKPVWTFEALNAGKPNGAVSSSPAISGGRVFFGCEDGILYGLGKGEDVEVVEAFSKSAYEPRQWPGEKLEGHEWHTLGGDMGYSCVSPDTKIKPPFRIKWKTKVWGVMKGPVVVGEGKVFVGARMGQLTALDAETGEIIWRTYHPIGESRPGATYAEGKVLILRSGVNQWGHPNPNRGVWCHDAGTGRKLWYKSITKFGYHANATGLAVLEGKVLACWNGGEGAVEAAAYALKDGNEVWKQRYENCLDTNGKISTRGFVFSAVCGDGRFYVSANAPVYRKGEKRPGSTGVTMALDPRTGNALWKSTEYVTYARSRIAFRKGILVVFGEKGGYALDPKTGRHLWTGAGGATLKGIPAVGRALYFGGYYTQALTDRYLDSRGRLGIVEAHNCSWSVYVNGIWYGHYDCFGPHLCGRVEIEGRTPEKLPEEQVPDKRPAWKIPTRTKVVWRYTFNSRACPAPAPAYGRLYYSPNGEGVVYCFEPIPK